MQPDNAAEGAPEPAPAMPTQSLMRRLVRGVIAVVLTTLVVLIGIWGTAALSLANLDGASPRIFAPALFVMAFLYVLIKRRPLRRARLTALAMCALVAIWYFTIFPSNNRVWVPEYVKLNTATIDGDKVTIHNYRIMEPGPDGKLREAYVDETFDVTKLMRADLIMSYWGPTEIAHALVTFEFSDGKYCSESIEVRRRASQKSFDMVSSLFRNFELVYVVGSERDMIGGGILDDHHRIFLYRTNMPPQRARALFMRYANKMNELAANPEWYNAITDNCTTGIYMHLRQIPPPPPFDITILINGYLPEYVYQHGNLDSSIPWPELNKLCDIKEIGRRAYDSPDFSKIIREQVPAPPLR